MKIKSIILFYLVLNSFNLWATELEGDISTYVKEVCDTDLLNYCNETPLLKSYLTVYAESFEGYMQAKDKKNIIDFSLKHYSAVLCIEKLYPKPNINKEIIARMKSSMLYSKERFSLYLKSERKAYEAKVHEIILSDNFVPGDCSSMNSI
ncbi:MAG: hypothetical protein GY928_38085 [Colwellia sp.]|nr:hypothetical protein [Colwellia sp.]